jgi:hypothetical protein
MAHKGKPSRSASDSLNSRPGNLPKEVNMRTGIGAAVVSVMIVGILSGCQASYEAEARSKAAAQNAESAATRAEAAARRAEQAVSKAEAAAQRAEAAVAKMEPAPRQGRRK